MRIQHNILSMNAYRNYTNNTSALGKNLEKLSSGYKINRAGDDAAGLAISEKMRAQIKGLDAAQKNVKDGISFVKTAEGAMQEIQDMLSRMKYLATQSANGTYEDTVDRKALQDEVDSLLTEIDRIADSANFNDIYMLNGGAGNAGATGAAAASMADADNLAGIKGVTFTPDTTNTEAVKAFNEAAKDGLKVTLENTSIATVNQLKDGDSIKVNFDALLDKGYKVSYMDSQTTPAKTEIAAGDNTIAVSNANAAKSIAEDATSIEFTITDKDGKEVGKLNFDLSEIKADGGAPAKSTVTLGPAADTAAAGKAKAAAGADAAKGPTFTENTTGSKLADFELKTLDLSNVKGAKDGKVNIEYKADKTLTIKVGDKTYVSAAMNTAPTAGAKVKLYTAGDADGTGDDGYVEVTIGDTVAKLGGTTAIAAADVGTVKAADDNAGGAGTYSITLQIGDTAATYNQMVMDIKSMKTDSIGVSGLKINDIKSAADAIDTIKTAINTVSSVRGQLGAWQNRLEHTQNNLSVMTENIQDAESTIRDTDVADEMMAYTKNNILIQSAQAMLAQANAVPQGVLQLLQ